MPATWNGTGTLLVWRKSAELKSNRRHSTRKPSYGGWDNYETARQLRQEAEQLSVGIVDEYWRNHPDVIKAVEEFNYPAFMDEEAIAFNDRTWG
jgi:hypothetical protein